MTGASCVMCANGKEAVEAFENSESGKFDAILLPVMNGYKKTAFSGLCT